MHNPLRNLKNHNTLSFTIPCFNKLYTESLKTRWEKGENAGYKQFFLFPQCFFALCCKPEKHFNKTTSCRCQHLAVGCMIEDKKSKSKKGHNSEKKNGLYGLLFG